MRFLPPICQPVSGICVYNVLFLSVAYGTVAHPIFFGIFSFLIWRSLSLSQQTPAALCLRRYACHDSCCSHPERPDRKWMHMCLWSSFTGKTKVFVFHVWVITCTVSVSICCISFKYGFRLLSVCLLWCNNLKINRIMYLSRGGIHPARETT